MFDAIEDIPTERLEAELESRRMARSNFYHHVETASRHLDEALNALAAAACRAGFREGSEIARVIGHVEQAAERLTNLEN